MKAAFLLSATISVLLVGCSDTSTEITPIPPADSNGEAAGDNYGEAGDFAGPGGGFGGPGGGGFGGGGGFDPMSIFNRRDADGDGKLAGDEIGERLQENLDQIDADGDGAVTREEFENGMGEMFAGRRGGGFGGPDGGFGRGGGSRGDPREGRPDRPKRPEMEE